MHSAVSSRAIRPPGPSSADFTAAPCRRGGRKNLLRQTCRSGTVGCRPDGLSSLRKTGRAHCARHRVRAREYGLVRTCTDLYGRLAQGCVGALCPGNSIAHGCVPCQPSASLLRHVHGVHQRTKHIPTGWQSALRNADTGGKKCRTGRTGRTCRTIGTGCRVCHALLNFQST